MVNHKNPDDLIIQIYPGPREAAVLSVLALGSGRLVGAKTLAWNQKREKQVQSSASVAQWAGPSFAAPLLPAFLPTFSEDTTVSLWGSSLELLLVSGAWHLQVAGHRCSEANVSFKKGIPVGISTALHAPYSPALGDLSPQLLEVNNNPPVGTSEQARLGSGRPARLMKDSSCSRIKWPVGSQPRMGGALEPRGLWGEPAPLAYSQ